jgi:histidinol-phosphate aminotransferase
MSPYLSERLRNIKPYVPGEQPQDRKYIKLNTNESPFPPSPAVLDALSREETSLLNLYPDPETKSAIAAVGDAYGLPPENIILGNGSDELLAFAFQAYCDARTPTVYADITYGFYGVFAQINNIESRVTPLDGDFRIDPTGYYRAGGTVFIANPNAPTGLALSLDDIEKIIRNNPDNIVVVDEAYVDFGSRSASPLVKKYPNLLVVHTMSKSKNLAGARLGYAFADSAIIGDLNMLKYSFNPYNVNRLSLVAAEAAFKDRRYYENCIQKIIGLREKTASALRGRGFVVLPGKTNFLFVKPGFTGGAEYYRGLKERGVLVRHFSQERIKDFVRITIGDGGQMDALLAATDAMLRGTV